MNETFWHKCPIPFWPRRTVDGEWLSDFGQCWRRKVNGQWEYQQDAETADEFFNRHNLIND